MTRGAAITGVGYTAMGALPGSSCMSIHVDAALAALNDAGLRNSDIDGVLCAYSVASPHPMLASQFAEVFGLRPSVCQSLQSGGATAAIMVMTAAAMVEAGLARHMLLVTGDNRLTGLSRDGAVAALAKFGHAEFEQPYGLSLPAAYALVARRYMHEYGATGEHLAAIAATARGYAVDHSGAHMREPMSIADVERSRVIASPLRLLDCSLISDGGAAVIVSGIDDASRLVQPVVRIAGTGQGHTHEHLVAAPSLTSFGCANSSRLALERAGIGLANIDVAEIYDSFTITLLIELESIGFFPRGEAGPAILAGELSLGGSLPCNTHGGLLSHGHSGAAGGMFHVVEAVEQLRGVAGTRQVSDPEFAFVHGDGGVLSAHCSLVLQRF